MTNARADRVYRMLRGHRRLSGAWALAAALLILGVALFANLTPHVEQEFFFASDDPALREDAEISQLFPSTSGAQIILSASGDRDSARYGQALDALSDDLARVPGIDGVQSLTRGPKDEKRAEKSPLWRRLVGSEDRRSTLVLAWLDPQAPPETVARVEEVVRRHDGEGFELHVSGVPYVVELIRRHLERDMRVFSLAAVVVFGLIVSILFRSFAILAGMFTACLSASCLTLLATDLAGMRIGVLTANLVTIVFIMTLHHIVYLTFSWQEATAEGARGPAAVERALGATLGSSFWVMTTTTLGFASLLFGQAQPLRELGISGAIGAVVGFLVAFLVHPSFLQLARVRPRAPVERSAERARSNVLARRGGWSVALIVLGAALAATGIPKLDRDPSLLSYFARGGEIREGLERIDDNGGSSPLRLVVRDGRGERLDRKPAYERLWALQRELEALPEVGVVISLPLIMAEAKSSRFGKLFTHRFLLEKMEQPKYGAVTQGFVTEDRESALYVLRMKEDRSGHDRLEAIAAIREVVRSHGFEVQLVGGLYALQGQMAKLVVSSLVTGVGQLLASFLVVALIVSRSPRWALALVATLAIVPAIVLGVLGHFRVPLDVISAPAINIALGMAIDDMLHMTSVARGLRREGADPWTAWALARSRSAKPLIGTAAIVSVGFAILLLSDFPPTQRFGLAVMGGAMVDVLACFVVLPWLASASEWGWKRRSRESAVAVG